MLSEKSCSILTDVNTFHSVYILLMRKLKGTLLACLAIRPAMHLQDCHSLPRRTLQYSHLRDPQTCWWRHFAKLTQEWLTTTYLLFGCCVLCLYRNAFVFPWVMRCNMHRQWCVSTLSMHMATLWLHSPCSVCTPHASSQCSSASAGLAQCHCTRADLPQASRLPWGYFAVSVWCKGTTQ